MTTAAENQILTQTGPGTPMGELFREYWIPAAMSSELKADGDPMRLMLLSEKLIAFRDTNGKVGVFDHRCPHRCASLFFGRNEEGGIRCVYHGWKFDADGNCLEMANVPPHQDFRHKVHAKAYPARERNGLIWVYMGKRKTPPPLPEIDATLVPGAQLNIRMIQRECNWLQAIEGELDTSHVGILHFGMQNRSAFASSGDYMQFALANRAPEYKYLETEYGHMYGGYRPAENGTLYWRVAHFLFPFWSMPPINYLSTNVLAHAWVPMDDTHTMIVFMHKKGAYQKVRRSYDNNGIPGVEQNYQWLPNTTDWYGRWRLVQNRENDYLIDRDVQRTKSYTGIQSIDVQDQAITESMGPIIERELEHLAPSDIMINRVRRQLLSAANRYAQDGSAPVSVDRTSVYARVRGGQFIAPEHEDWLRAYNREIEASPWESLAEQAAE